MAADIGPEHEFMTIGGGARIRRAHYLAGFKGTAWPSVPMLDEKGAPTLQGTIDDLAVRCPELEPALYNEVKACEKCGKPCAATMTACNACGSDLQHVPVSKSENVFTAFLFGVEQAKRGFPWTISLRRQTQDVLIFDDMLALTPCHLNAVSAKYYIPDWRFLLTDPPRGLRLLATMEQELWTATQSFLLNAAFRKVLLKTGMTDDSVRSMIIRSFNMPPSQFQLHVQWLVPPLIPFQHYMAEIRNHFHEDRAFPLEYVRQLLELNEPYKVTKETPVLDIVKHYNDKVDYKRMWTAFYEKALRDSMELASCWDVKDFEYVIADGKAYNAEVVDGVVQLGALASGVDPKIVQEKDKAALQNYGRPYSDAGKPTGTYIPRPLQPKLGPGGYEEWPGVAEAWGMRWSAM